MKLKLIILIVLVGLILPFVVSAQSSLWYLSGSKLRPNVSTWGVMTSNLSDMDGTNFFDGGCTADQYISGISNTGAISCGSDSAGGGMVYPDAGIALSTGAAWGTSITNNSANWNTAYGWGNWASGALKLDQTSAQTFTGGGVTGTGLLKVTSGLLGLNTSTYLTTYVRSDTKTVCANDSLDKVNCDYICDGTNDEVQIQAAIDAVTATGGTVKLMEGTFNISASITPKIG